LKFRVRGTQERINPVSIILKGKNRLRTRTIWNSNGVLEWIKFGFQGITVHIPPKPTHKWATFTYIGRGNTYITYIFKHSRTKIAYHTNNTIHDHLTYDNHNHDKFSSKGVHKLTCLDCNKAYVGQTSRNFIERYNEHRCTFQNNSHTSRFAQHLNEHAHSFGSIDNITQILCHQKNRPHLNTTEQFYIHKEAASGNHLNDNQKIFPNRIFDTILKIQHS